MVIRCRNPVIDRDGQAPMIQLTHERPDDAQPIESLLDTAFGPDRLRKTSYQYRVATPPVPYLRFVAREHDALVGTIRYWPVSVGGGREALLLGPIAVDPERGARGVGGALIRHSLSVAAEAGHGAVLLVGDIAYYGRFGFRHAASRGIVMPGEREERLLVHELAPGALHGVAGPLAPCTPPNPAEAGGFWLPTLAEARRWLSDQLDLNNEDGVDPDLIPATG